MKGRYLPHRSHLLPDLARPAANEILLKVAAGRAGDYHHLGAAAIPAAAGLPCTFSAPLTLATMRDNSNYRACRPAPSKGHLSPRLDGAGHQKSWAIPTQPHVPWCPLFKKRVAGNSPVYSHGCKLAPSVAEGVAGKPGLFTLGRRRLYFRYSSQGGRPP